MAKYTALILILWCSLFFPWNAFALNSGDIVRLKRAGVSDKVIEEIIRSKAIVRALVSVDEVIEMKAAGIGDGIILAMIEGGNATAPELDEEDAADRALRREMARQEMELAFQKRELDLLVKYLSRLVGNPDVIRLVDEGKITSEDYARIVKYLKQYARGEETLEYGDEGDIKIDIDKAQK